MRAAQNKPEGHICLAGRVLRISDVGLCKACHAFIIAVDVQRVT
jgi:hypothetical protein